MLDGDDVGETDPLRVLDDVPEFDGVRLPETVEVAVALALGLCVSEMVLVTVGETVLDGELVAEDEGEDEGVFERLGDVDGVTGAEGVVEGVSGAVEEGVVDID